MKSIEFLLTLSFLISTNTFAGREVGNGGDVVTCSTPGAGIYSIEALDTFEARTMSAKPLNLGPATLSFNEKLEIAIGRIAKYFPSKAARVREVAQEVLTQGVFIDNQTLKDIPDSQHLVLPNYCQVEQIIIQQPDSYPGFRRFLIDNDLWKLLDDDNKVVLLIHEALYHEALHLINFENQISLAHESSIPTRRLTGMIVTGEAETLSMEQFAQRLFYLGFIVEDIPAFKELQCVRDEQQFDKFYMSCGAGFYTWMQDRFKVEMSDAYYDPQFGPYGQFFLRSVQVEPTILSREDWSMGISALKFQNGQVETVCNSSGSTNSFQPKDQVPYSWHSPNESCIAHFFPSSMRIRSIRPEYGDDKVKVSLQGHNFSLYGEIEFWESGRIKAGTFSDVGHFHDFNDENGNRISIKNDQAVRFLENGLVCINIQNCPK